MEPAAKEAAHSPATSEQLWPALALMHGRSIVMSSGRPQNEWSLAAVPIWVARDVVYSICSYKVNSFLTVNGKPRS